MIDFALLGHPADYAHFLELADRDGQARARLHKHRALVAKFIEWSPSYLARETIEIPLPDGRVLNGRMIVCPFLPESLDNAHSIKQAHGKVLAAAALARDQGARFAALGGFTSILQDQTCVAREAGGEVAFTSGARLTAILAVRQIEAALASAGRSLGERTVAVVGATGDVGSIAARLLAPCVRRLILIARFRPRLERLAAELGEVDVCVHTDTEAVVGADTVLLAAGARSAVADEDLFAPGALVCDVGYPKNISHAPHPREDIVVFSGGLARFDVPLGVERYTRMPAPEMLFGCFAEAIALAAAPGACGLTTAPNSPEAARGVERAALAAGIVPARPWRGEVALCDADFARVLDRR